MSSIIELNDDDLTTDACPNPPRDEAKRAQAYVEECEEITDTIHQIPRTNDRKKPKKTKRIPNIPTVANVINIANCNGVQIGQNYTINMSKSDKKDRSKENVVKTEAINKLLECREPVTREHIDFVATHAGEGWRDIGRNLNYSEGQIYQFEESHSIKGVKEVIYHLLLDWIQNEPDQATLALLGETLWNSGQQIVVKMLAKKLQL